MKKFFSTICALFAFAFLATPLSTPAFAQEVATSTYDGGGNSGCSGDTCLTGQQWTGVWTGGTSYGEGATFGNAFTLGDNPTIREAGTTGFSEVVTGMQFNAGNCGDCESGAFTGSIFGEGVAGQRSFSNIVSPGGYVEGGSTVQAMTNMGGDWFAARASGDGN